MRLVYSILVLASALLGLATRPSEIGGTQTPGSSQHPPSLSAILALPAQPKSNLRLPNLNKPPRPESTPLGITSRPILEADLDRLWLRVIARLQPVENVEKLTFPEPTLTRLRAEIMEQMLAYQHKQAVLRSVISRAIMAIEDGL